MGGEILVPFPSLALVYSVENYGTFINKSSTKSTEIKFGLFNYNGGTFQNEGRINFSYSFRNMGVFTNSQDGEIVIKQLFINTQSATNEGNINFGAKFSNTGTFNNTGIFSSTHTDSNFDNNGTFVNEGKVQTSTFANINTFTNKGIVETSYLANEGTFTNEQSGKIDTKWMKNGNDSGAKATFTNNGTVEVKGEIINHAGATFTNNGTTKSNDFRNYGTFTNNGVAEFSSAYNRYGFIGNYGTFINLANGTIIVDGHFRNGNDSSIQATFTNNGTAEFKGEFTNHAGATFNNNNKVSFIGGFLNQGIFNANENSILSGAINNKGIINAKNTTFNDTISNEGIINAEKIIFNNTITTKANSQINTTSDITFKQSFENVAGAKFTNNGTANFEKGIINSGTFINNNGGVITFADGKIENYGNLENYGSLDKIQTFYSYSATVTNAKNASIKIENELKNGRVDYSNEVKIYKSNFINNGEITTKNFSNERESNFENTGTFILAEKFYNSGNFTNDGSVKIVGKFIPQYSYTTKVYISNYGTFTNNGTFTTSGEFENYGTLNINQGTFANIKNSGIINAKNATFDKDITTIVTKNSTTQINILKDGQTFFKQSFENVAGAKFTNNGTANFEKGITNSGTFINNDGGVIMLDNTTQYYDGLFKNLGTLENYGKIQAENVNNGFIDAPRGVTMSGNFINGGDIIANKFYNMGGKSSFENIATGKITAAFFNNNDSFENKGKIIITKEFRNKGHFINNGTIEADSDFYIEISNSKSAIFTNNGTFTSTKGLINSGILNANAKSKFNGDVINYAGIIYAIKSNAFNNTLTNQGIIYAISAVFDNEIIVSENSKINITNGTTTFSHKFENVVGAEFDVESDGAATFASTFKNDGEVSIKGGVLTATTFTNNGKLNFLSANADIGKIIVSNAFTNESKEKIKIDISSLNLNQDYTFVVGSTKSATITGLESERVEIVGGHYKYDNNGTVRLTGFENIATDTNKQDLQNVIEQKLTQFGTMISKVGVSKAITDTEQTLQKSYIAQPKNMLNTFKTDTLNTPLQSAYVSRLTASSETIMNDSSNFINPLERASQTQFFATPFGGVLKGNELSGHLFGLSLGLTHISDTYIAQGHFAYAKGQSTQDLATQSTELNGDLFQAGGFTRLMYGKAEMDINANFVFGKFSINNLWFVSDMNSNSNFNNYQVNLGGVVGWRFGGDLSVKPFVGVQGYYENQGGFKQESGLGLESEAYSSTMIDALAGLEGRYIFDNGSFIFAKGTYENKLYNSHKEVFMRMANESLKYENETYDSIISANIGARVLSTQRFKLDIEALYKRYDNELNYFGGNVGVKFSF